MRDPSRLPPAPPFPPPALARLRLALRPALAAVLALALALLAPLLERRLQQLLVLLPQALILLLQYLHLLPQSPHLPQRIRQFLLRGLPLRLPLSDPLLRPRVLASPVMRPPLTRPPGPLQTAGRTPFVHWRPPRSGSPPAGLPTAYSIACHKHISSVQRFRKLFSDLLHAPESLTFPDRSNGYAGKGPLTTDPNQQVLDFQ